MHSFLKFLAESSGGTLYVFDIDDTMFHTTAKVGVMDKSGKIIKRLSSADFTDYKLAPDERYDYSEFRNADKFHGMQLRAAQPHPIQRIRRRL